MFPTCPYLHFQVTGKQLFSVWWEDDTNPHYHRAQHFHSPFLLCRAETAPSEIYFNIRSCTYTKYVYILPRIVIKHWLYEILVTAWEGGRIQVLSSGKGRAQSESSKHRNKEKASVELRSWWRQYLAIVFAIIRCDKPPPNTQFIRVCSLSGKILYQSGVGDVIRCHPEHSSRLSSLPGL